MVAATLLWIYRPSLGDSLGPPSVMPLISLDGASRGRSSWPSSRGVFLWRTTPFVNALGPPLTEPSVLPLAECSLGESLNLPSGGPSFGRALSSPSVMPLALARRGPRSSSTESLFGGKLGPHCKGPSFGDTLGLPSEIPSDPPRRNSSLFREELGLDASLGERIDGRR